MTNVVCSSKETDVNIGKLGDAKALEDGYVHQADTLTNDLHILPTVEKRVAGSREPRSTCQHRGLLKEPAAGWRERVDVTSLGSPLWPCIAVRALPNNHTMRAGSAV